jgi:outer membrane receptor for ferrienterochelin and colicins
LITRILHIILFSLAASHLEAANVVLTIQDKSKKEALAGAIVSFEQDGKIIKIATQSNGTCLLKEVTLPLNILVTYIGFEDLKKTVVEKNLTTKDNQFYLTLQLKKQINVTNEVIITGQSKPILATQSIYKVNTISNIQIAQRGAVTLNDVLNYELNNFISNDNVLGSSVSVAGIGGQNVKILINGIPVLGRENGNIELGQLNMNNIKRVETIQGPMSVMYGSNALGGVINLITTTPTKQFTITPRIYLESIGKYNLSTSINFSKRNHSLQGSLARNFFQGWTPKDDSADRFQLWKPKTQYTGDLQYNFKLKKLSLTYFTSFMSEKITNKGIPIVNPFEGYAFDEYYRTQRAINSLGTTYKIDEKSSLNLLNSYSIYNRKKNRFKKDLVTLEQFPTENVGDQDTSIFRNINLRGTYQSTAIKKTEFNLGYEYNYDQGKSYKLASEAKSMTDVGLFASLHYAFKKIDIQPSARYTINNRFGRAFTPAFHAKINLTNQFQLRASYANGFRAPSLKEMYLQFIDQNHTIIGNDELKPEIGNHAEISAEHRSTYNQKNVTIAANGSYNAIQNMITLAIYDGSGVLRKYANMEKYRNWLFNTRVRISNQRFSVEAGAGLIYVENTGFIPQHTIYEFSNNISYLIKPLKTNINFNYKLNSKQPVLTIDEKYLFTAPIQIANVSFQKYLFSNALSFQMGVKNLFNLQTSTLSSSTDLQGGGHLSTAGLQIFPERSIFMDIQYKFNQ